MKYGIVSVHKTVNTPTPCGMFDTEKEAVDHLITIAGRYEETDPIEYFIRSANQYSTGEISYTVCEFEEMNKNTISHNELLSQASGEYLTECVDVSSYDVWNEKEYLFFIDEHIIKEFENTNLVEIMTMIEYGALSLGKLFESKGFRIIK